MATDLGDDSENEENSENGGGSENGSITAEELAERFKGNPEGLRNYRREKEDQISQEYIDAANFAIEGATPPLDDILDPLRNTRDNNLARLNEKCNTASELNDSETDYSDWTTDRDNSPRPGASPSNSEEDTTNQNEGSSNSNVNTTNENQGSSSSNLNTTNQESSSTSTTEGRFKQDSSDIMPDTEPMDFDDPTG